MRPKFKRPKIFSVVYLIEMMKMNSKKKNRITQEGQTPSKIPFLGAEEGTGRHMIVEAVDYS